VGDLMDRVTDNSCAIKLIFFTVTSHISLFLTYIGLNKEAIYIFASLIIIDYITGIAKARALEETITSNKMKYGIVSKISLLAIPISLALASKVAHEDMAIIFNWAINLLIISEAYSIIGNVYSIRTHKELPEWDVIAILGKRIKDLFSKGEK
jgi:toxin secretion/phage lysis holin